MLTVQDLEQSKPFLDLQLAVMRVHFLSLQFSSLAATHLKSIEPIGPPPKMTPLSALRASIPKEVPQE